MVQEIWSIHARGQIHKKSIDHFVYFRKLTDDIFIYLILYMNDTLIAFKSKVEIDKLKF